MNDLIQLYQKHFNLQNATFMQIEHVDATVAIVYKVILPDGRENILKICARPSDFLNEAYFLNYFSNKILVPHIINLVKPESNVVGAILMECIQGDLLKTSDLTENLAYEIGLILAKIHSHKAAGFGDLTQPHHLRTDPGSYFSFKFAEGMGECAHHLPKQLLNQCQNFYDDNIRLLLSADGPCIVHRDFRPGNLLVKEGKLQGIIDWSSARGSFAEEDFCFLELDKRLIDASSKISFLKGYASIRPIPNYMNVMPLLLISKAIATIGFTVKTKTWNNINTNLYWRQRKFLRVFFK